MRHVIEINQLIYVAKAKSFQNEMEIRYDCAERYHILCMKYAEGILFKL